MNTAFVVFTVLVCIIFCMIGTTAISIQQQLCQPPPKWYADGRDIMKEHLGNVTLVALMELHCTFCKNQINSLERLLEYVKQHALEPTRFIIIASMNETLPFVEYYRNILSTKGFTVVQESKNQPAWRWLGGCNNDFFIYDPCGRLSFHIPYPQSFTYYHYTINTLYSVHRHQRCGSCSFYATSHGFTTDSTEGQFPPPPPAQATIPPIHRPTLPYYPSSYATATFSYYSQDQFVDHSSVHHTPVPRLQRLRNRHRQKLHQGGSAATGFSRPWQPPSDFSTRKTPRPVAPRTRPKNYHKTSSTHRTTTSTTTTTRLPITTTAARTDQLDEDHDFDVNVDPTTVADSMLFVGESLDTSTAQIPKPMQVTRPMATSYPDDNEASFEDEIEHIAVTETKTDHVISKIDSGIYDTGTSVPGEQYVQSVSIANKRPKVEDDIIDYVEADKSPSAVFDGAMRSKEKIANKTFSKDCTSFSDAVCHAAVQKGQKENLHPCCNKGIYLTSICSPTMCSTRSYSLCCFQKLQQARYSCCHNMTLRHDRPDRFSQCCYTFLVQDDDPCCPTTVAFSYWTFRSRVMELCLPTIDLNFEGVVLNAETKEKHKLQVKLGDFKSMFKYKCPAATKRPDFFFYQPEPMIANSNGKNGSKRMKKL